MPQLSVLICTLNDRIKSVQEVVLPPRDDVRYVVSLQYTDNMFLDMLPEALCGRDDVTVLPFPSTGLSANRNNALSHCATPIAIISDDDVRYKNTHFDEVIRIFDADPKLDIAVFAHHKMAVRITSRIPPFDTRFGIGSAFLTCGEEELMEHQSKVYGLNVKYFPSISICNNVGQSPWERFSADKRVRRSWAALQYMKSNTCMAILRMIWRAITSELPSEADSKLRTRWIFFRDMFDGLRYIMTHPLNDSVAEEIPFDFQPIDIYRLP